jgi:nuclear transport factor 2 (NTF2) superfamily protein
MNRLIMTIADNNHLDILSLDEEDWRTPRPPFTEETAILEVRLSEDAWNARDPERVALACSLDSEWRNRSEFLRGRQQIVAFLTRKWGCELEYRLRKTVWTFTDHRIAVRFEYEWHTISVNGSAATENENWSSQPTVCWRGGLRASTTSRLLKPSENFCGRETARQPCD